MPIIIKDNETFYKHTAFNFLSRNNPQMYANWMRQWYAWNLEDFIFHCIPDRGWHQWFYLDIQKMYFIGDKKFYCGGALWTRVAHMTFFFANGKSQGLGVVSVPCKCWGTEWERCESAVIAMRVVCDLCESTALIARFMGPTWGPSGPTGPRWAPCWPHELCYLGVESVTFWASVLNRSQFIA